MDDLSKALLMLKVDSFLSKTEDITAKVLETQGVTNHLLANGYKDINDVESLVRILKASDFLNDKKDILEKIVFDGDLIPDNTLVNINKKKYKMKGQVWIIHQNDVDPFPSSPHAHNYDENLVMHLGNGKLFRDRKHISTVKEKEFLKFRQQVNNVVLPALEV
ncbi:TPA: hypothetical protein ACV4T5_002692 [Yersinia enterocolitica]